jgi:futalosine hydrolase
LNCEALWSATLGCEVLVLVASDVEAAMLAPAIHDGGEFLVAGKRVMIGDMMSLRPAVTGSGEGRRVVLAISGLDKVNASHLLTCLLQAMNPLPRLVLQTGIAGALPAGGEFVPAAVGDVVIATQEAYSDTGSSSPLGWLSARELGWPVALVDGLESGGVFRIDGRLVMAALEVLAAAAAREDESVFAAIRPEQNPRVFAGPCITASIVTGVTAEAEALAARWGALAESMEGAAAAHVSALYGVPFLEVRGISNLVGDRDRARWQVRRAVAAASWAARAIVDAFEMLPVAGAQAGESA